ncbi:MAG: profilin, required for normal timing of actin polymerization in response to thermal stress [Thelocarpon impressellum]|nr:MAG: profilin, required for normal timing of actin polymerization in response to thermal stress [Thelocarpon impressellum]
MSWQEYVDSSLVGSGNLDKAAIFNSEGTSVWASSAGFKVSPAEIKEVVTAYSDKGDENGVKAVQSNGLHIAGERFVVLKADERALYGKKGKEGIVIVKTNQAILLAHYPETVAPGVATNVVEQLADYLISVGY